MSYDPGVPGVWIFGEGNEQEETRYRGKSSVDSWPLRRIYLLKEKTRWLKIKRKTVMYKDRLPNCIHST